MGASGLDHYMKKYYVIPENEEVVGNINLKQQSMGFYVALVVKNPSASAGDIRDMGSIPRSGRSPGGGHGNPLQYSCLENPMD